MRTTAASGATGTAVVSFSRKEMLFLARVCQVWSIDDDGPHSAGLFD